MEDLHVFKKPLCDECDAHESKNLRFFGDDFAVLPNVDRRAVHAGGLGRASEGAPNSGGEFFAGLCFGFSFHGDLSNNFGVLPELSYMRQASAKRR